MNRDDYLFHILRSMVKFQHNVALILEAKADESEKARNWVLGHHSSAYYDNHSEQVKHPLDYHVHLLDVIDGLTKLEHALTKNLQTLLGPGDEPMGIVGGLGDDRGPG